MKEATLCIIKPDAVKAKNVGNIIKKLEHAGFQIVRMACQHRGIVFWSDFYKEHEGKDFFAELVTFMSSGHVVSLEIQKENGIADYRKMMGPADPSKAAHYTLRNRYGTVIPANAVHGSDSMDSANRELKLIFGDR